MTARSSSQNRAAAGSCKTGSRPTTDERAMDPRLVDLSHLMIRPVAAWRAAGWWGQTPLWERVCRTAASNPDRTAVIDETGSPTAAALWSEATAVSAALRAAQRDIG